MANTKIIFLGAEGTGTEDYELRCFWNSNNHIAISILDDNNYGLETIIALDKATAIKFSKELRKQISYIEEEL